MRKYIPYILSGIISGAIFHIMTDFCFSEFAYSIPGTNHYIIAAVISAGFSMFVFLKAMKKSPGSTFIGTFLNVLFFIISSIIFLIITSSLGIHFFRLADVGDDPGNLMFMIAWMIYFPICLVAGGILSVFIEDL